MKKLDYSVEFQKKLATEVKGKSIGVSLNYDFFHPINGSKLDLTICKNPILIYMPIKPAVNVTKSPYKELVDLGVDFYDMNHPFYNDRCFIFQQNETDIPLNIRRKRVFPNNTVSCGSNCVYKGIKNKTLFNCECKMTHENKKTAVQEFTETLLQPIDSTNLLILKCKVSFIFNLYLA